MTDPITRRRFVLSLLAALAWAASVRAHADGDGGGDGGEGGESGGGSGGGESGASGYVRSHKHGGDKRGGDKRKNEDEHDDEPDHNAARAAVRRGEALPLSQVIGAVAAKLPGEIVEIEFEREDNRWIYEFKVIDGTGRLREIYVDAATARILREGEN